jgi:hypothetical protein
VKALGQHRQETVRELEREQKKMGRLSCCWQKNGPDRHGHDRVSAHD